MKKDLVTQEEIDKCLRYVSVVGRNNKSAQEQQLLKLLQQMQITLDEPEIEEDSIDGARIRVTYITAISRKRAGVVDEDAITFQYIKEIPVDYNTVPIRLRDNNNTAGGTASSVNHTISHSDNAKAEETIIESYDELEKGIPTLYEVLGLLKRIYFMPEEFSNRLVVDRIHKLRNMFSKDEIFLLFHQLILVIKLA